MLLQRRALVAHGDINLQGLARLMTLVAVVKVRPRKAERRGKEIYIRRFCGFSAYRLLLYIYTYIIWNHALSHVSFRQPAMVGRLATGCSSTTNDSYLVDPASSHMLVSKIKPCMSKYKHLYCETANGSLNQLSFIWLYFTTWIPVVILELIHAKNPNFWKGCIY